MTRIVTNYDGTKTISNERQLHSNQAEELAYLRQQLAECQTMRGASVLVPQAELEAIRKDAERYRWLRDSTDNGWIFDQLSRLEPYEFSDAIDQAMREGSDENKTM